MFEDAIGGLHHSSFCFNLWQETYGEDPYLSGQLSVQYVQGLQGNHPRYLQATGGCKHFDVHGGPENIPESRLGFNAVVSYVRFPL